MLFGIKHVEAASLCKHIRRTQIKKNKKKKQQEEERNSPAEDN